MQARFLGGLLEVRPLTGEICRDGSSVRVEPKVMEVLVLQTIPKRGYRLVTPVSPLVTAEPEAALPAPFGQICPNTIAVLPSVDVGNGTDAAHLGEGVAEEIVNRLSAVNGLRIVARTSSFSFRESTDDCAASRRSCASHVLEGSVRRSGERVRINAQLIDGQHGYALWATSYEGVIDNIFLQCRMRLPMPSSPNCRQLFRRLRGP
jgi:adenylate cyclase